MNRTQHTVMLEAATDIVRKLKSRTPSCTTCNFYYPDKTCGKFNEKPPKEFVKDGCPEWIDDAVPF